MEKQVIFREYHSQEAGDHNNLQTFAQQALDHITVDAVTSARRFAGFTVSKSDQAEVTIQPGRMYDTSGAIFARDTSLSQSMLGFLPAAAQRIVSISVYGGVIDTETEQRDKLVDQETGETTAVAVDTVRQRQATLVVTQGQESADPQPPALPAEHVEIARILLDPTQVVQVTQLSINQVVSTQALDTRSRSLEAWRGQITPKVNGLGADLADLARQTAGSASQHTMRTMRRDIARIKEALSFPSDATNYGASYYMIKDDGDDYDNSQGLGYDIKIEEGLRFPDANANQFEISLFSQLDPNASLNNGILLPKYSSEVKIANEEYHSQLGMAQYGFQNHEVKVGYMSRSRLRYGGSKFVCTNGVVYDTESGVPVMSNVFDFESQSLVSKYATYAQGNYIHYRENQYWFDSWREPFLYTETTDHAISGAEISQTIPITNDIWCDGLDIWVAQKGGAENIHLAICEVIAGQPDKSKTIAYAVLDHNDIVTGWNTISFPPTFLGKGGRFAAVLISNSDHQLGMTSGQQYLDGTFFYSTDGAYYQGDLTKDLMFRLRGARFDAPHVTIEFQPINLDGGFRDIDIMGHMWAPESTELIFEMRPGGAGDWQALTVDNLNILDTAPPLAQFRARFIGTRDMMPALQLTGSRVSVSRPKTSGIYVSDELTLASASDSLVFEVLLENFDDTPHDHTLTIKPNGAAVELPDLVSTTIVNADERRVKRVYSFSLGAPITAFSIIQTINTNSASDTCHVAELVWFTT